MNDELAAAWTTLRTTPLGSLDNDTDLERVEKAILTVLAALERALPLLPLADVIERLEAVPEWSLEFQKFRLSAGIVSHLRTGLNTRTVAEDTLPDAIRALAQAVESEAKT